MATTLGDRVHLSRRELAIKQADLARLAGVSRTYISQIETGAAEAIMTDVLLNIAKALNVSPTYLLGLTDAPAGHADDGAPIAMSPDRLVFEIRDAEMRAAAIELMAIIREMTPAQRRLFVEMAQKMQRLLEAEHDKAPLIIGD